MSKPLTPEEIKYFTDKHNELLRCRCGEWTTVGEICCPGGGMPQCESCCPVCIEEGYV